MRGEYNHTQREFLTLIYIVLYRHLRWAVTVTPEGRQRAEAAGRKLKVAAPEVTESHIGCIARGAPIKRIIVRPGGRLSLQTHHRRSEHWIVVRGTAQSK
ncbi:hypothetical protein JQ611_08205 [Bradyrhizobium sp. AUGA SZCCT0182]|nr:hypothetical protein [Bradyrhizobium sp. AUGA SZCCT0182]